MTMEIDLPRLKAKPAPTRPLRYWLWKNHWTLTELADALGVDKGTISRIADTGRCSNEMAERIKRATGLKSL